MFIRAAAGPSTALNYLLTTTPSPLEITPAGTTTPTPAVITVTAANPDPDPVRVVSVKFTIVVGSGAGALTEHPEHVTLTATPGGDWTFTHDGDGSFLAVPAGDKDYVEVTDKAVLFELTNIAVNAEIGVTTVDIAEKTQDPDNDGDTVRGSAEFQVGKCFPGFQFADLQPTILDQDKTSYSNGDHVTLSWTASHGAVYEMLHDDHCYDVTTVRTWTTPDPVHRDATFHLRAKLTTGSDTVTHYLHTNVTVNNPDLTLTSLVVGDVAANGNLTALGADKIVRIRELRGPLYEELKINSTVHVLPDNDVVFDGACTVRGDLAVKGAHTVDGTLNVGGALTVDGDVAAEGNLTAVGADKIVRIRDLRGPYGEELKINSTVDVLSGNNVNFNGSVFGQTDWEKLRNFINGTAKFHIYNNPADGGGQACVYVSSDGTSWRIVKANYQNRDTYTGGGEFQLYFQ